MKSNKILLVKHVRERLNQLRKQDVVARPPKGWIRFIREALNMSSKALSQRVGISPNTMSEAEKAEVEGGITIKRLERVANAMDCDLVYYFLPRKPIREMIDDRARHVAEQKIRNVENSTYISSYHIEEKLKEEVSRLKHSKKLWDNAL